VGMCFKIIHFFLKDILTDPSKRRKARLRIAAEIAKREKCVTPLDEAEYVLGFLFIFLFVHFCDRYFELFREGSKVSLFLGAQWYSVAKRDQKFVEELQECDGLTVGVVCLIFLQIVFSFSSDLFFF